MAEAEPSTAALLEKIKGHENTCTVRYGEIKNKMAGLTRLVEKQDDDLTKAKEGIYKRFDKIDAKFLKLMFALMALAVLSGLAAWESILALLRFLT